MDYGELNHNRKNGVEKFGADTMEFLHRTGE